MHSIDYIRRAVAYKDEGHTFRELKDTFNIPIEKSWANMKHYLRDNIHDYQFVDSAIYEYFGY